MHARMLSLEGKSRELLVQQGSVASGAAVALSALISRLNGLVEELVSSYNISEQELEVSPATLSLKRMVKVSKTVLSKLTFSFLIF